MILHVHVKPNTKEERIKKLSETEYEVQVMERAEIRGIC